MLASMFNFCCMQVTDEDLGTNSEVDFSLDGRAQNFFSIIDAGPLSVELYLSSPLDRETAASLVFGMFVVDRGLPPLVGQTEISITVMVSTHRCQPGKGHTKKSIDHVVHCFFVEN